jgi:hypothetical protein
VAVAVLKQWGVLRAGIHQNQPVKWEPIMPVIDFPTKGDGISRLETVLMDMAAEKVPFQEIAKAWLRAGQFFAANGGGEDFLDHMADLVEPVVKAWRAEAGMMRNGSAGCGGHPDPAE